MATNSREARRRKIVERSSDRLALITGRIQTLPSSSSSSPEATTTHHEVTDPPSQPLISHHQDPPTQVPDEIQAFTPKIESEIEEKGFEFPKQNESKVDTNTENSRAAFSQVQPLVSSSTVQNQSPSLFQPPRLFTATGISTAIDASESTRIYISTAVALLVALAHLGFPLLGSKMVKTLLGFRPLYLVLLTNVTLVIARIFGIGRRRVPGMAGRIGEIRMPTNGYEWTEVLGKALEIGLVVKKVIDAVFMDCAVYAIIVVCGLSFAKQ